jgi:hypothetical protein
VRNIHLFGALVLGVVLSVAFVSVRSNADIAPSVQRSDSHVDRKMSYMKLANDPQAIITCMNACQSVYNNSGPACHDSTSVACKSFSSYLYCPAYIACTSSAAYTRLMCELDCDQNRG